MPHLSQLQRDFEDKHVTIIGLTSEDKNNTLQMVEKMVENKGDGMAYTVAFDDERKTNEAYMKAANQRGIPTSFLVDQSGKIAWIGHPQSADIPIAMVVDKTWDYEKGPALMKEITKAKRAIASSARTDPKKALELLKKFRAEYPPAAKGLENVHFSILARLPEHSEEATELGREIIAKAVAEKNHNALNGFAWNLVDPEVSLENRFLGLAMLAADKANELSGKKNGAILDTVARVYFWRGDLAMAIEIQKRAVEHAQEGMKDALNEALIEYQKALQDRS